MQDIVGHAKAKAEVSKWGASGGAPLLVHGPPGVGKTSLARAAFKGMGLTLVALSTEDELVEALSFAAAGTGILLDDFDEHDASVRLKLVAALKRWAAGMPPVLCVCDGVQLERAMKPLQTACRGGKVCLYPLEDRELVQLAKRALAADADAMLPAPRISALAAGARGDARKLMVEMELDARCYWRGPPKGRAAGGALNVFDDFSSPWKCAERALCAGSGGTVSGRDADVQLVDSDAFLGPRLLHENYARAAGVGIEAVARAAELMSDACFLNAEYTAGAEAAFVNYQAAARMGAVSVRLQFPGIVSVPARARAAEARARALARRLAPAGALAVEDVSLALSIPAALVAALPAKGVGSAKARAAVLDAYGGISSEDLKSLVLSSH
jgi:DNA polymerase III delta prime subunit